MSVASRAREYARFVRRHGNVLPAGMKIYVWRRRVVGRTWQPVRRMAKKVLDMAAPLKAFAAQVYQSAAGKQTARSALPQQDRRPAETGMAVV